LPSWGWKRKRTAQRTDKCDWLPRRSYFSAQRIARQSKAWSTDARELHDADLICLQRPFPALSEPDSRPDERTAQLAASPETARGHDQDSIYTSKITAERKAFVLGKQTANRTRVHGCGRCRDENRTGRRPGERSNSFARTTKTGKANIGFWRTRRADEHFACYNEGWFALDDRRWCERRLRLTPAPAGMSNSRFFFFFFFFFFRVTTQKGTVLARCFREWPEWRARSTLLAKHFRFNCFVSKRRWINKAKQKRLTRPRPCCIPASPAAWPFRRCRGRSTPRPRLGSARPSPTCKGRSRPCRKWSAGNRGTSGRDWRSIRRWSARIRNRGYWKTGPQLLPSCPKFSKLV